VMSFTISMI